MKHICCRKKIMMMKYEKIKYGLDLELNYNLFLARRDLGLLELY